MAKISKETAVSRTRKMIAQDRNVPLATVKEVTNLRKELLYRDDTIAALETDIETDDFKDVKAKVFPSRLKSRKTVLGIAGVIWSGIPKENKK